jgi:hypothetical protein
MMTDSDELYTETLADRDLMPPGFDNPRKAGTEGSQIETFQYSRYLKVGRSAALRKGAKISKFWNHGTEYRALDNSAGRRLV